MTLERISFAFIAAMASAFLAACDTAPTELQDGIDPQLSNHAGATATATGGGDFFVSLGDGFQGKFAFSTVQKDASGAADGAFHYSLVFVGGETLEFFGRATCMTVDTERGRAWIGGVITRNNSTHPGWRTDVHEPGRDIWFRVVDNGEGQGAEVDRTTFVGFEGGRGIITSEEYCEVRFWDEESEPWAVINGNLQVRAR